MRARAHYTRFKLSFHYETAWYLGAGEDEGRGAGAMRPTEPLGRIDVEHGSVTVLSFALAGFFAAEEQASRRTPASLD